VSSFPLEQYQAGRNRLSWRGNNVERDAEGLGGKDIGRHQIFGVLEFQRREGVSEAHELAAGERGKETKSGLTRNIGGGAATRERHAFLANHSTTTKEKNLARNASEHSKERPSQAQPASQSWGEGHWISTKTPDRKKR